MPTRPGSFRSHTTVPITCPRYMRCPLLHRGGQVQRDLDVDRLARERIEAQPLGGDGEAFAERGAVELAPIEARPEHPAGAAHGGGDLQLSLQLRGLLLALRD